MNIDLTNFVGIPEVKAVGEEMELLLASGWSSQDIVGCMVRATENVAAKLGVTYESVEDAVFAAIDSQTGKNQ
jgi:hypothetical protein